MARATKTVRRVLAGSAVMALGVTGAAVAVGPAGATGAPTAPVFYLDIGASVSVGMQPTVAVPRGQPTSRGYANQLVAMEAARGVTLQLTQLGCPGDTLTTFVSGRDACYKAGDSQLADAIAFLRAHYAQAGLVTLDLGFNTIHPCLAGLAVNPSCATQRLADVQSQLTQIVAALKAAAGPNVAFVGVGHYNPFYAAVTSGAAGRAFAAQSAPVMQAFNDTMRAVYASFSIPFANVAEAFTDRSGAALRLAGGATVSGNAARACALTWVCAPAPYGPNLHPTDAGYQVMAAAIAAVVPATL